MPLVLVKIRIPLRIFLCIHARVKYHHKAFHVPKNRDVEEIEAWHKLKNHTSELTTTSRPPGWNVEPQALYESRSKTCRQRGARGSHRVGPNSSSSPVGLKHRLSGPRLLHPAEQKIPSLGHAHDTERMRRLASKSIAICNVNDDR